jgi:hypothetical protein
MIWGVHPKGAGAWQTKLEEFGLWLAANGELETNLNSAEPGNPGYTP